MGSRGKAPGQAQGRSWRYFEIQRCDSCYGTAFFSVCYFIISGHLSINNLMKDENVVIFGKRHYASENYDYKNFPGI